jgi:hypothetical protein
MRIVLICALENYEAINSRYIISDLRKGALKAKVLIWYGLFIGCGEYPFNLLTENEKENELG